MNEQITKVGVSCIVYNRECKVLMGKRLGVPGAGDWAFPGGLLKYGENPLAAAQREMQEKTGLDTFDAITQIRYLALTSDIIEGAHCITLFYQVYVQHDTVVRTEPEKYKGWEWHHDAPCPLFHSVVTLLMGGHRIFPGKEHISCLMETEEALLEAQNERDELRKRLDKYEPPFKPKKFS